MRNQLALFALSRGVVTGQAQGSLQALRPYDPLLRWRARHALRRALTTAQRLTSVDDERHVLRLAYLRAAADRASSEYDDPIAIEQRYRELTAGLHPPRRGPWLSASLAVGVALVLVASIAAWHRSRPFDARAGAQGELFAEAIPDFVVALAQPDSLGSERLAQARSRAAGERMRSLLGDEAAARLGVVLDRAEQCRAARDRQARQQASRPLLVATAELDEALVDASIPYFVDATFLERADVSLPVLLTFYVQWEEQALSRADRIRVVYLWRLDILNLVQGYVGYTRDTHPAAMVLLDQTENELVRYVLPALAPDEPLVVVDEATRARREDWAIQVMRRAAEVVREHYRRAPISDPQALQRVGELVARRRTLLETWQAALAGQKRRLRLPRRLIPERDYSEELALRITRAQLREWDRLHAELLLPRNLDAFLEARNRYLRSVARHEVQHRLDHNRGPIPLPGLVAMRLGLEGETHAGPRTLAGRTRDEVAAFLASIAEAQDSPLLDLVLVARYLFDREHRGGPYSYAGLAALEGIALQLGINVDRILGTGSVSRRRSAKLFCAVVKRRPEQIQQAARRAFRVAFGRNPERVRFEPVRSSRAWRH